jgi:hypothetical protein
MIWRFTLELKVVELTDALAESLDSHCSDATLSGSGGCARVGFDREAVSLQAAIHSAVNDVRSLGLHVERVEIEAPDLVETELAQWSA